MEANWWSKLTCIKTLTSSAQQQAGSGYLMFPLKFGVHWFSEFSSGKSQFGFYTSWILQYGFLFYVYTPKSSVDIKLLANVHELLANAIFFFKPMQFLFFVVVVVQSLSCVWLFAAPWAAAWQASLFFAISWSLLKLMSIESVMPSNHLIFRYPLLLLPSVFPSIRIFPNELALHNRWSKYWSFSINPSNKY